MASKTTNYELIKPDEEDFYDVNDTNKNMDILDGELKSISDKVGELEEMPNQNLFLNSDFNSNVRINQRGESVYSSGYTIDRWVLANAKDAGVKLTLEDDCIKIESTNILESGFTDFRQKFEKNDGFKNRVVTATVDIQVSEGARCSFYADGLSGGGVTGDGVRRKLYFTYTYGTHLDNLFTIRLLRDINSNVGDYIKIFSIKVELGKIATKFISDDPTIELLKCQRYYIRQRHVSIACTADNHGQMLIPFNANMRIRPVVTFLNDVYAHKSDGSEVRLLLEAGFSKTCHTIRPLNGECVYLSTGDGSNIEGIQNGIYTLNQSGVLGNTVSGDFIVELNAEL